MRFQALIRTHHITSRKKVATLKRAADTHQCFVLLRSGGCPGIMYVEGNEQTNVESWVAVVRKLRYKDFQLVGRPGAIEPEGQQDILPDVQEGLSEVESVKEFGDWCQKRGIWQWWRKSMGYA
ncbi:uncharacterized protein N7483_012847 [Penicillium malachiteum]|uniref:uncharacterized protein n=1 Tax=Penicillium malachiteum TaxID=1324776 RepID=UPI002546BD2C|nr:uncharacterized protein N7483_012847 [Penicillium malachiteum]KAJ5715666.1 hypothetical protein N7483_012847 [Penicillium malachiteum]